jgi:hypothetical protein
VKKVGTPRRRCPKHQAQRAVSGIQRRLQPPRCATTALASQARETDGDGAPSLPIWKGACCAELKPNRENELRESVPIIFPRQDCRIFRIERRGRRQIEQPKVGPKGELSGSERVNSQDGNQWSVCIFFHFAIEEQAFGMGK